MILAFGDLGAWERDVLHWVTCRWHAPWLGDVLEVVQHRWVAVVFVVLGTALLARRSRRLALRTLLTAAVAVGVGLALATPMWYVVGRDRPTKVYERVLVTPEELAGCAEHPEAMALRSFAAKSPAFPSHHAVTAGALAMTFWFAWRPLGLLVWVMGLIVGWARLYFGRHWPTDVLGGYLIGALCAAAVWWLLPKILRKTGLGRFVEPEEDPQRAPPPVQASGDA